MENKLVMYFTIYLMIFVPFVVSTNFLTPKITIVHFSESRYFEGGGRPTVNLTFQNDTAFQVPAAIGEISFDCSASYPIMWDLANSGLDPESFPYVRVRSQRSFIDVFDPSTYNYSTQLRLSATVNSNKLTGNYTCQSTANSMVSSSIYVFWEGTAGLVHSMENLVVYLKKGQVILPCTITDPHKPRPKLWKLHKSSKGDPKELSLNRSISFSPTTGYVLKDVPFPLGKYMCKFGDDDHVTITVKEFNVTAAAIKKAKSNATFTFDRDKNEVTCCSSSRRPPNIIFFHCDHATTCQFREHAIQPYHFILSRNKRDGSCSKKVASYYHTALIRCIGDGIDEYMEIIAPVGQYYSPWSKKNITIKNFFRWGEIEPQDMLTVSISSRYSYNQVSMSKPHEPVYSQQPIYVECQLSPYYFSDGSHWTVLWKNKSLTHPEVSTPQPSDHYYYGSTNTLSITIDISMKALICFAPVWNSSLWVTKTFFLHVNETISPKLTQDTSEDYSWSTNEKGKQLICEAIGTPKPDIVWLHGDQVIREDSHNYNLTVENNGTNVIRSVLKILTVSYVNHGVYSCKASNYGGDILRIFRVTVQDQSSWKTTTIVIISGIIICFLLLALGIFLRRMHMDKQAIQQLTAVHFKDPETRDQVVGTDVTNTTYDNGKMTNQLI